MLPHDKTTMLLTGMPRSGTTLVCALLNAFADTLALAEPINQHWNGDRRSAVEGIGDFIAAVRHQALTTGMAITKHLDGVIPDNWVEPPTDEDRLRKSLEVRAPMAVGKPLSEDFRLIIKHPALFTALAGSLMPLYPMVALVRHPLAVLASWQTIDGPFHRGRMPIAERFSPDLVAALDAAPERVRRQVTLMGWLLRTYAAFPAGQVVRYEDLIADPLPILARFSATATRPTRHLAPYDPAERYPRVDLPLLARELMAIEAEAEKFYPDFKGSLDPWLGRRVDARPAALV